MQLTLSSEQDELRATVRRLLASEATSAKVRAAMNTDIGYDEKLWRRLGEARDRGRFEEALERELSRPRRSSARPCSRSTC